MAKSLVVFEIFNVDRHHDLEMTVRANQVIESSTIRYTGYGFLLSVL